MADQRLTDLTAAAQTSDDDIFYLVDDPSGTPASRKITAANLRASMSKLGSSEYFYLGDPNTNGSWRIGLNSGSLVFEKRISGSWVEKGAIAE